jgi:hypothetical protein
MASAFYNRGKAILTKALWESGNIRVLLVKSGHSFNADNDFVSDIVADECTFTNYARKTPTGMTATIDDTNDRVDFSLSNLTWTSAGGGTNNTVIAAVIYDGTSGADSTRELIAFIDFTDIVTNGADISVLFATPCLRHS